MSFFENMRGRILIYSQREIQIPSSNYIHRILNEKPVKKSLCSAIFLQFDLACSEESSALFISKASSQKMVLQNIEFLVLYCQNMVNFRGRDGYEQCSLVPRIQTEKTIHICFHIQNWGFRGLYVGSQLLIQDSI